MKKKIVISEAELERYKKLPLQEQYATLCALKDPIEYDKRYAAGLDDFLSLIDIQGVAQVGINWDNMEVLVGTEYITYKENGGTVRQFGHYVVALCAFPSAGYRITNVTRTVDGFSHPHATQHEQFCMSTGNGIINACIIDGKYSDAMFIIMRALCLQGVTRGTAYSDLEKWPVEGEEQ